MSFFISQRGVWLSIVLLVCTSGWVVADQMITMSLGSVRVQSESLPISIPDYPLQATLDLAAPQYSLVSASLAPHDLSPLHTLADNTLKAPY